MNYDAALLATYEFDYEKLALLDSGVVDYLPLLVWLTKILSPTVLVNIGQLSTEYLALCEIIDKWALPTQCYNISSQSKNNDNALFYHQQYQAFSKNITTKEIVETSNQFKKESIDLLIIDSYAVSNIDSILSIWQDKLSAKGLLVIKGIDFSPTHQEAYNIWERLIVNYPYHFRFNISGGVGVIKLSETHNDAYQWAWLNASNTIYQHRLRKVLATLANKQKSKIELANIHQLLTGYYQSTANGDLVFDENTAELCSQLLVSVKQQKLELDELKDIQKELEKNVDYTHKKLGEANHIIDEMRYSRSWRITKALRNVGNQLRRITAPKPERNVFSLMVIALFVLPATFFYYQNLKEWIKALKTGKTFFSSVIFFPDIVIERLKKSPQWLAMFVITSLKIGLLIHKNGSILAASRKVYHKLRYNLPFDLLTTSHSSASEDLVTQSMIIDAQRILVMDYRIPMSDISAGERATVGILKDLAMLGYEVVFLPNNMVDNEKYSQELIANGIEVITNRNGYHSAAQYLQQHAHTFELFYLIRVDVAEAALATIRRVAPMARVIFHAPDLSFLREMRGKKLIDATKEHDASVTLTRQRELSVMQASDHVVIVSQVEQPILEELLFNKSISVFPALYASMAEKTVSYDKRTNLFFLGGFAHQPNIDAVQWFVNQIWPLIQAKLPQIEFHIIGADAPDSVKSLARYEGVKYIGYVEDLDAALSTYRVAVAPLRYGAGIKGKVAMAMGGGIPTVCSTIAAEGMNIKAGIHALVADEVEEFALCVVELYQNADMWQQMSVAGQRLIDAYFSPQANRYALLKVLNTARVLSFEVLLSFYQKQLAKGIVKNNQSVALTVIVSLFNQKTLNTMCLTALINEIQSVAIDAEIVLLTDVELTIPSHFSSSISVVSTIIDNDFSQKINQIVSTALGDYVLIINNDILLLPNSLHELLDAFDSIDKLGMIGAKVLLEDGKIKEAGSVLANNGQIQQVAQGSNRYVPFFSIQRETDCLIDGLILIKKTLWQQVGGLDNHYQSMMYAKADLAMLVRQQGFKVVYQPTAEILQLSDNQPVATTSDVAYFTAKWQQGLTKFAAIDTPIQLKISLAEKTALVKKQEKSLDVLYFSPFPSHPTSHGNRATIYQYARRFQAMGHRIHFVLLEDRNQYSATDLQDMQEAWDTFDEIPFAYFGIDPTGIPFDGWYKEGLGECIRALCAKYSIDIVFCSYVFQSKMLEYVPDYMLKVIDTHDKMGNRYEMLRANNQPLEFFSCTPEEEGRYLQRADIVVARRQEEADYFNQVTHSTKSIVVPHVEPPVFLQKTFKGVQHVGLVASANRINLALVLEFLQTLATALKNQECPFVIHIAGEVRNMVADLPKKDASIFAQPWVKMHGFVPDIADFYREMDLIVAPVTMGTGINVKTVQAMAYGMPLLTTTCGSKGIETVDEAHNHEQLTTLVEHLFKLAQMPVTELERLATLSRQRYQQFYDTSVGAMQIIFEHPKLQSYEEK